LLSLIPRKHKKDTFDERSSIRPGHAFGKKKKQCGTYFTGFHFPESVYHFRQFR